MSLSRRDMLKLSLAAAAHPLLPARGIVSQVFAAPGAGDAKFLLVFLRGGYDCGQRRHSGRQRFLLRVAADDRAAAARRGQSAWRRSRSPGRARRASWGLHPALKDSMLPLWQKAAARVRAVRRQRGSLAQPLRDPGQRRGRMPVAGGGPRAQLRLGLPQPSGRRARRRRRAGRVHRRAADRHEGRHARAERLAQGHRPGAVRRSADGRCSPSMYTGTRFEPLIAEGFDLRQDGRRAGRAMMADGGDGAARCRRPIATRSPRAASSSKRGAWPG